MGSTQWQGLRPALAVPATALLLLLGGCGGCPLPGQRPMTELQLFFGRSIPGVGLVDDAAWAGFAADTLTPAFPDGFTAYEALGQWRDPRDGEIVRQRSTVVQVVGVVSRGVVDRVMATYRTRFRQVSVGIVTHPVCAAF